mgnify:CR=1 FL=1
MSGRRRRRRSPPPGGSPIKPESVPLGYDPLGGTIRPKKSSARETMADDELPKPDEIEVEFQDGTTIEQELEVYLYQVSYNYNDFHQYKYHISTSLLLL